MVMRLVTSTLLCTVLLISCGSGSSSSSAAGSSDCQPGSDVRGGVGPSGDPGQRIEDIEFVLTGLRQTTDEDSNIGEATDDQNFGGVWGNFDRGIVVAVVDCSEVDVNELARIAGGADQLTLIEVPYTYRQVSDYRDALADELRDNGIRADVPIRSDSSGRSIEVRIRDRNDLPPNFGESVPDDIYTIVETSDLSEEG